VNVDSRRLNKVRTFILSFRHPLHAIGDLVLLAERVALVLLESSGNIESDMATQVVSPQQKFTLYI
jgi:hypothetical protein